MDQNQRPMQQAASEPTVSIEFGRTEWGSDYAERASAPNAGTLFSVWTKIPDPGSPPWSRGNMECYILTGANWHLRAIAGNASANSSSDARYNANTMFFADGPETYVADYTYYDSVGGNQEAPYLDWVWCAWQVVIGASDITMRQWLRFGTSGSAFAAGSDTVTFAAIRTILQSNGWSAGAAAAWTPGQPTSFNVGSWAGGSNLTRACVYALGTEPSLATLDAIAEHTSPDTNAWADYPLNWTGGAANLSDVSGNGRNLTLLPGGTLYEGPTGPL